MLGVVPVNELTLPQEIRHMHGGDSTFKRMKFGVVGKYKAMQQGFVKEFGQVSQVPGVSGTDPIGHLDFKGEIALGQLDQKINFPTVLRPEMEKERVVIQTPYLLVQFGHYETFELKTRCAPPSLKNRL